MEPEPPKKATWSKLKSEDNKKDDKKSTNNAKKVEEKKVFVQKVEEKILPKAEETFVDKVAEKVSNVFEPKKTNIVNAQV